MVRNEAVSELLLVATKGCELAMPPILLRLPREFNRREQVELLLGEPFRVLAQLPAPAADVLGQVKFISKLFGIAA